ncbi:hypothetical protein ABK040_006032 [Willaertia magna]
MQVRHFSRIAAKQTTTNHNVLSSLSSIINNKLENKLIKHYIDSGNFKEANQVIQSTIDIYSNKNNISTNNTTDFVNSVIYSFMENYNYESASRWFQYLRSKVKGDKTSWLLISKLIQSKYFDMTFEQCVTEMKKDGILPDTDVYLQLLLVLDNRMEMKKIIDFYENHICKLSNSSLVNNVTKEGIEIIANAYRTMGNEEKAEQLLKEL